MKFIKYVVICIILDFLILGVWAFQGQEMTTKKEVQVKTMTKDEFGDDKEMITWKKEFRLGLVDGVLPLLGANALVIATLVVLSIKAKKQ
jgi:hypothetical protein